jgi:eukaryotic-like serine/threonine-protein kinase
MDIAHATAADSSGSLAGESRELPSDRSSSVRVTARYRHAAGDVIAGRYRIIGLLGEGGMGTVWRAHCLSLDIEVAIKVLHREHANATAAARLLREARATASLGHPAIVRPIDFGEMETGEPFLVMELLEGISLAGWLQERGRMSAAQAVQMLLPIAGALAAAHAHGVVHRDIKPENILVVPDGPDAYQPKVVDFGIAKVVTDPGSQVLTEAGTVLGSLAYMSPEQADGRVVGEQTDVWGLCVVLYELITGRRPFDASTLTGMILALYACAPAPTTDFAAGDEELWAIIERGLRKSPAERWQSMRALGCALAFWAAERGIIADAAGTSLAHSWLATPSDPGVPATPATGEGPISTGPTGILTPPLPPSETLLSRSDPPPSSPSPVAAETAYTTSVRPSPRRRVKALVMGAVAALLLVPVVAAAGLGAHRAGAQAVDTPAPAVALQATASIQVAPDAVEPPGAVQVETAAPPPAAISGHPAMRAVRAKRATPAMPLPAAPNF